MRCWDLSPAPLTVRSQPSLWFNSNQIEFLSEDTVVRIIPKMSLPRMEFIRVRTRHRRTDSNARAGYVRTLCRANALQRAALGGGHAEEKEHLSHRAAPVAHRRHDVALASVVCQYLTLAHLDALAQHRKNEKENQDRFEAVPYHCTRLCATPNARPNSLPYRYRNRLAVKERVRVLSLAEGSDLAILTAPLRTFHAHHKCRTCYRTSSTSVTVRYDRVCTACR